MFLKKVLQLSLSHIHAKIAIFVCIVKEIFIAIVKSDSDKIVSVLVLKIRLVVIAIN